MQDMLFYAQDAYMVALQVTALVLPIWPTSVLQRQQGEVV